MPQLLKENDMSIIQELKKEYCDKQIYWSTDSKRSSQMLNDLKSRIDAKIGYWVQSTEISPLYQFLGFESLLEYCCYALNHSSLIVTLKRGKINFKEMFDLTTLSHANLTMYIDKDTYQRLKSLKEMEENLLFKTYLKTLFPIFVDAKSQIAIQSGWFGIAEKMIRRMNVKANMLAGYNLIPFRIITLRQTSDMFPGMIYEHVEGIKSLAGPRTLDILNDMCALSKSICPKCGLNYGSHNGRHNQC